MRPLVFKDKGRSASTSTYGKSLCSSHVASLQVNYVHVPGAYGNQQGAHEWGQKHTNECSHRIHVVALFTFLSS